MRLVPWILAGLFAISTLVLGLRSPRAASET
jgi:hypothetical protein